MKNKREQEAIRAYFAQEPVPVEIHNALRQACQQLPPREESPAPAAGKAWRRLGGALSTARPGSRRCGRYCAPTPCSA